MRTPRPSPCGRLLFIALLAAFAPGFACASDLDLNLSGRPCLNGACLSGFECVDAICVPTSSSISDDVAMADSGGLIVEKDSDVAFPGSAWPGLGARDGGDKDAPKPVDGGGITLPADDAGPIAGSGGSAGTAATGGTGGTTGGTGGAGGTGGLQASGGTGGVEPPPPPPCASEARCGGGCVDLANDAAHCGRCDKACASVELCVEGECRAECEAGGIEIGVEIDLDGDDDECPEACDACVDGTCQIHCEGEQACKERAVECPAEYACSVGCNGKQSCEKLELDCADGTLCSLRCAGEQACKDAKVACNGAHCEVLCVDGVNACEKTQLQCGSGACGAVCGAGQRKPDIQDCMRSCSTGCGCEEP